jgi:hypothetical protein
MLESDLSAGSISVARSEANVADSTTCANRQHASDFVVYRIVVWYPDLCLTSHRIWEEFCSLAGRTSARGPTRISTARIGCDDNLQQSDEHDVVVRKRSFPVGSAKSTANGTIHH